MKLTSKQKMCVGVVCLGLVAIGIDRLVLAPKGDGEAAASTTSAAKAPAARQVASSAAAPSIADRLRAVADAATTQPAQARDAFRPSSAWVAAAPVQKAADEVARFRAGHRLSAVMTGARGFAVIDGRVLAVGQIIDGFKLVGVSERSATFNTAAGQVTLKIQSDATALAAGSI